MLNHLTKAPYIFIAGLILMMSAAAGGWRLSAQDLTAKIITGTVLEEDGKPSEGVAVMIKGTQTGTLTDAKGEFALKVTFKKGEAVPVIVFSCLGKETQEYKCTRENFHIVMKDQLATLVGAVINTGYQKLDRRMSASSVASISGTDALQSNAVSLDNMLQGKIPGMTVLSSSSTPGASTKIRIRGTSTISGNREPLWVVDGVILDDPVSISTEELNDLDNVNLIGNAISGLNPMDIEKIDVLKDASATAIYGVRAANGVIVVTTKRGKQGAPRIRYGHSDRTSELQQAQSDELQGKDRRIQRNSIQRSGLQVYPCGHRI